MSFQACECKDSDSPSSAVALPSGTCFARGDFPARNHSEATKACQMFGMFAANWNSQYVYEEVVSLAGWLLQR